MDLEATALLTRRVARTDSGGEGTFGYSYTSRPTTTQNQRHWGISLRRTNWNSGSGGKGGGETITQNFQLARDQLEVLETKGKLRHRHQKLGGRSIYK